MGDARRFDTFAEFIARNFPNLRDARVADAAGGKGYLRAALYQRGFCNVETWDKCKANRRRQHRKGYRFELFDYRTAPPFDLVVGMHPDGATDHIIKYAIARRAPFAVVPCCVIPSAEPTTAKNYGQWIAHLHRMATRGGLDVFWSALPISGRGIVIAGRP